MATYHQGQRVTTPRGAGAVAYQRLGAPDYCDAIAVSVVLDCERLRPGYTGTIFSADQITRTQGVK